MYKTAGDRVFFANSGAEANEGAIKLARKYFRDMGMNKYKIQRLITPFTAEPLLLWPPPGRKYQIPFLPLPPIHNSTLQRPEAIKKVIDDETCAIMIELIQGEGGIIEADYEYKKS